MLSLNSQLNLALALVYLFGIRSRTDAGKFLKEQ